jgi:hypothetical protein
MENMERDYNYDPENDKYDPEVIIYYILKMHKKIFLKFQILDNY